jgi:hypothetical protein
MHVHPTLGVILPVGPIRATYDDPDLDNAAVAIVIP